MSVKGFLARFALLYAITAVVAHIALLLIGKNGIAERPGALMGVTAFFYIANFDQFLSKISRRFSTSEKAILVLGTSFICSAVTTPFFILIEWNESISSTLQQHSSMVVVAALAIAALIYFVVAWVIFSAISLTAMWWSSRKLEKKLQNEQDHANGGDTV